MPALHDSDVTVT